MQPVKGKLCTGGIFLSVAFVTLSLTGSSDLTPFSYLFSPHLEKGRETGYLLRDQCIVMGSENMTVQALTQRAFSAYGSFL